MDQEKNFVALTEEQKIKLKHGAQNVLSGRVERFELTFSDPKDAWTMDVQPIQQPAAGALVRHAHASPE